MNPKRWQEIERLYHEALARDGDERSEFLRQACGGDDDVRQEVESLLSQATAADRLVSGRAAGPHDQLVRRAFADAELPGTSDPTASVGTLAGHTIGPYRLHSSIGAGGMGEVSRPGHPPGSRRRCQDRLAEIRGRRRPPGAIRTRSAVLASLNHPNIATIHGIEDGGGIRGLVMELVEGLITRNSPCRRRAGDRRSGIARWSR